MNLDCEFTCRSATSVPREKIRIELDFPEKWLLREKIHIELDFYAPFSALEGDNLADLRDKTHDPAFPKTERIKAS